VTTIVGAATTARPLATVLAVIGLFFASVTATFAVSRPTEMYLDHLEAMGCENVGSIVLKTVCDRNVFYDTAKTEISAFGELGVSFSCR
jgi:hypothetical protein